MTKKEEKNQDENILEEALKKVQQEKIDQEDSFCDQEKDELIQKIALLEKEKQEALDIASKVQYDYVNLKTDFDRVQRLSLEKEKTMESDFLMKYIKKILPIVDLMKSSLNHIDESKKDDPFVK
jgi:molecular chaperone GrpE (heat shock protein)